MIIVLNEKITLDSHRINLARNGVSLVAVTCINVTCENHTTISIVNVSCISDDTPIDATVIVTN